MVDRPTHSKKTAIITGASRGIGRSLAVYLDRQGYRVAVTARSSKDLEALSQELSEDAVVVAADLASPDAVNSLIHEIKQRTGCIDVLINNAVYGGPIGPFLDSDPEDWWLAQEINLRGAMLCCRYVLPYMVSSTGGRIINMSSSAGYQAIPGGSAYSFSKTALIRFSEQLAYELQDYPISVWAMDPGAIKTDLTDRLTSKIPEIAAHFNVNSIDRVTDMVHFLLSGRADNLSGRMMDVRYDISFFQENYDRIVADEMFHLRLNNDYRYADILNKSATELDLTHISR